MATVSTAQCARCQDTGKCPTCGGVGSMVKPQDDGRENSTIRIPCRDCFCTGKCWACQSVTAVRSPS